MSADNKGGGGSSPSKPPIADISIDSLLDSGLLALQRGMKMLLEDITVNGPNRENTQNLKDYMVMLHDLKEKENEKLKDLSEDDLRKLLGSKVNGNINASSS